MRDDRPLQVIVQDEVAGPLDIDRISRETGISRFDAKAGIGDLRRKLHRLEEEFGTSRTLIFCSLNASRIIMRDCPGLSQGLYLNERFLHWHVYAPMLPVDILLNHRYVLLPFGALESHQVFLREIFGDKIFIRPNSPMKIFPGLAIDIQDMHREIYGIRQVHNPDPADLVVISAAATLPSHEYRFWLVGGQAISPAGYSLHSRHEDAPCCPEIMKIEAARLAEHLKWVEDAVVADFVMHRGRARLVELNGLSTSGFYPATDLSAIVRSVDALGY